MDRERRRESISVLEKWNSCEIPSTVEEICQFIGLPIIPKQTVLKQKNPTGGLVNFAVKLNPIGPKSPLPGFGSRLNSDLNVVVVKVPKEPEEISEFVRQNQVSQDKGILVVFERVITSAYRLKWLKECIRSKLMMLPLDGALILYLCGQRSRLNALFDIGLPLTWAQPYITKGEMVEKEMFVGRENEVSDLIDINGSCIVFGGRQLGKSALLTHVKREFHNANVSGGEYVAYLDVNTLGEPQTHQEMIGEFWRRVSTELRMLGAINEIQHSQKSTKSLKLVDQIQIDIESVLREDDKKKILLLLDETDKLLELDSQSDFNIIRALRSLMAKTNRRFKVVLAGLQSVQRYNNWKNHPFAQLGNEIVIDPLQPRAAEDLITRPFRALGFLFENPALVSRIVSISNYHPGLIQIFCYQLLSNLYEKYPQWKKIERLISEEDVLAIEQDASFKQDVRDRFDWTLDLDDRYKVLTYGLVLSDAPTEARSLNEFKKLGVDWWSQEFSLLETQDMRALLDELVGLGVLLAESDVESLTRQFRIRSPNLLRLLGPKFEIEEELLRIVAKDSLSRPNPNNFRRFIEDGANFGPLTYEQEGRLSNSSENYSTTVVLGSTAMGLRQVADQIRNIFQNTAITERTKSTTKWREIRLTTSGGATNSHQILEHLSSQLAPQKRDHRYAIINFEEIAFDEDLGQFLEETTKLLNKKCRSKSQGRLFVILNPEWSWKWKISDRRLQMEDRTDFAVISLKRWSNGAISNALDHLNRQTGSKSAGPEIYRITSGVHKLVTKSLNSASFPKRGKSAGPVVNSAIQAKNEVLESSEFDMLSDLGIEKEESGIREFFTELYLLCKTDNGEYIVSKSDFEQTIDQFQDRMKPELKLGQKPKSLFEWLNTLDLIRVSNDDADSIWICPLTMELVSSSQI